MHLAITFLNGFVREIPVRDMADGYDKANGVSLGTIRRLEIVDGEGARALWDRDWDAISQAAGMRRPL